MSRARSFNRNGAIYVELRGLDADSNYKTVLRIAGGRIFNLVGMDVHGMRFRIY